MPISIRNPRVEELAREMAQKRNVSMTEVILESLEAAKKADLQKRAPRDRIDEIVEELHRHAKPGGHMMTKEEIDQMWGHE
jgi:antitoxin VapB